MKVGIIGAGYIGKKRAANLPSGVKVSVVCDLNKTAGLKSASELSCDYEQDWKNVVKNKNIDALFIAVTHNWLAQIGVEAIKNGKHVLIEKPGAKNLNEFNELIKAHIKNPVAVMFGYNHRYHPALIKAKEFVDSKKFGEVMFIRARYGHGARLGYEKEWRFNEKISGGGELIDQGPHLIDLVNYLVGEMNEVTGFTSTMFWKTDLEDNAFFIMRNDKKQIAHLCVTCVEWKNIFSFEIMLKTAKIQIEGLGRSYGDERMVLYKMKPEMGPPVVEEFNFPKEDLSWKLENEAFFEKIRNKDYSDTALLEGQYVHKVIKKIYKLNREN
ncbi:MAG: Gfo/Idh/MocA family oxidoreductase [Patescibacteria group bacterium]